VLAERDPVLARLVAEAGLPSFPKPTLSHFAALVRSIVYQQLAGAAARAIHGRLVDALDGEVTPERILDTSPEVLRAAGLSGNKLLSLRDLAAKVLDGTAQPRARRLNPQPTWGAPPGWGHFPGWALEKGLGFRAI
jgi:DNA-3-methyladenine glycosylase II